MASLSPLRDVWLNVLCVLNLCFDYFGFHAFFSSLFCISSNTLTSFFFSFASCHTIILTMSLSAPKFAHPLPLHHRSNGSPMSFNTSTPFLGSTQKLRFIAPIKLNARSNSTVVSVSDAVKNKNLKSATNLVTLLPFCFSYQISIIHPFGWKRF